MLLLKQEKLARLYQNDPAGYALDILEVAWTPDQQAIATSYALNQRTIVKASHSVGKSHLGGGLINWVFDCFPDSIALSMAVTKLQIVDNLWKEVRAQRRGRPGLLPKAPRMEHGEKWFAAGMAADSGDAFQGRHGPFVFIHFDEATGIPGQMWDAMEGMLVNENRHALATFNPTDPTSRAYDEEMSGLWNVFTLSALQHPNIAAELAGLPRPYPNAVSLQFILGRIQAWCQPISASDKSVVDFEFPPGSGKWYRPGPLFEGRVLGRWPSKGGSTLWTDAMWSAALIRRDVPQKALQIGCDVARYGDDYTSAIVRRGPCLLHHETHNGWSTVQTAKLLMDLAGKSAERGEDPKKVCIAIDDGGVGGGVTDIGRAAGYNFVGINGSHKALDPESFPNRRSELWFTTSGRASDGELDVSRLSSESRELLRTQLLAQKWKMDGGGRRVVESKDETKKRSKKQRSPDDADAFNLAFAAPPPPKAGRVSPALALASWGRR